MPRNWKLARWKSSSKCLRRAWSGYKFKNNLIKSYGMSRAALIIVKFQTCSGDFGEIFRILYPEITEIIWSEKGYNALEVDSFKLYCLEIRCRVIVTLSNKLTGNMQHSRTNWFLANDAVCKEHLDLKHVGHTNNAWFHWRFMTSRSLALLAFT